jgi:hypothetical protein
MDFVLKVDKGRTRNEVEWDSRKGVKENKVTEVVLEGVGENVDMEIKISGPPSSLSEFDDLRNATVKVTVEKV